MRLRAVAVVVAVFTPFVGGAAGLAATTPGATADSIAVDISGNANYAIPIVAPPGTAGMVPSIALSYVKSNPNPVVGVGFAIGGLSTIQRCHRTIALDGARGTVSYDENDRFCLDGQRLLPVGGGFCGNGGVEYRTERETFARVCAYRDPSFAGSGPQYFRVFGKIGRAHV